MCKPVSELELEFADGFTLYMRFDVKALMHLTEFVKIDEISNEDNFPEMCAYIVYSSSCEYADITIDKAREIVSNMDIETITNIITEFSDSIGDISENLKEINQKNVTNRFQTMKTK